MDSMIPILRARRERRIAKQRVKSSRLRSVLLGGGTIFSLLLAAFILVGALTYADVTRGLPSVELLPQLLNPPDGMLLQPTRIYDRSGTQLLFSFSPDDAPRRYIPINEQNPQHIPANLINSVIVVQDPQFWSEGGYVLEGYQDPQRHPTIAQKLVSDLLLYNEPPSLQRAIRERILAAQITAEFGRTQIIEWYLNSVPFGHYAFGVEAASELYFGKSAAELTLAESAILAATSETPALNALDAPQIAIQRGREVIHVLNGLGIVNDADAARALIETPAIRPVPASPSWPSEAFANLVITQLESDLPRERIERGGLNIISTLDFDLQRQATCATEVYAARIAGLAEPDTAGCDAARLLPSLPPGVTFADSSASALILDPRNGQVLALVGETNHGAATPLLSAHSPGSGLDGFVYLTAFTRGLSPATLTWDIPGSGAIQNFDGKFHGPLRLRIALANDYQVPVESLLAQMGSDNVNTIAAAFGVDLNSDVSMLQLAGAYGVFDTQGVYFGQNLSGKFAPSTVLRVEAADHTAMLNLTAPQAKSIVSPALAYLMTNVLSDESARWPSLGQGNALEIGRPAAVKVGQSADGLNTWIVGYTPSAVVATWTGAHGPGASLTPRFPAVLWNALMQYATRNAASDGWTAPHDISTISVCDPSGMLPTRQCPNLVTEVFLNGNEPVQADNLYREFAVNRETGLLATVFTPPELIESRVYLLVPDNARDWARSAGLAIPPTSYDAIQPPAVDPNVNITAPQLFADVNGVIKIIGTASGADFSYYRVQVGQGLNPQEWIQLGADSSTAVENGVLADWDTKGLSGLYAVKLLVVRKDQRVDTAVIQVTVK